MKKLLFILFTFLTIIANGQAVYNPSYTPMFTVASKPYAISQGAPVDGRSYKMDSINFIWRLYNGTSEVLSYLNQSKYRTGQFPIEINIGGTLNSNGTFTGGYPYEYWFRGGTADSNLVLKSYWPPVLTGFLQSSLNLSDVSSVATSRTNLGLGAMAQQNLTAASADVTGNWPGGLIVNSIQGNNLANLRNYNNLTNTPTIPAQLNPSAGTGISITGIYPNLTWSATASLTFLRGVGSQNNYLSPQYTTPNTNPTTSGFDSVGIGTLIPNALFNVKGRGNIDTIGITNRAAYLSNWHTTINIRDSNTVMTKGYADSLFNAGPHVTNGIYDSLGYIGLGGNLVKTTDLELPNDSTFSLNFNNFISRQPFLIASRYNFSIGVNTTGGITGTNVATVDSTLIVSGGTRINSVTLIATQIGTPLAATRFDLTKDSLTLQGNYNSTLSNVGWFSINRLNGIRDSTLSNSNSNAFLQTDAFGNFKSADITNLLKIDTVLTTTTNYTVTNTYKTTRVILNATSGTITLPDPTLSANRNMYVFIRVNSSGQTATITPAAGNIETSLGVFASSATVSGIPNQGWVSNGTNWVLSN